MENQLYTPEILEDQGIKVSFLNTENQSSDFYVDGSNAMSLEVTQSTDTITLNAVDLSTAALNEIPILIEIDNVLSPDEISSLAPESSGWSMSKIISNNQNFWALSPAEGVTVGSENPVTLDFAPLTVAPKPSRNGQVNIQLNYSQGDTKGQANFRQTISLLNGENKPLSQDLQIEFVDKSDDPTKGANAVFITRTSAHKDIDNALVLRLNNLKGSEALISELPENSSPFFYLSFVAQEVAKPGDIPLATTEEIDQIDVFVEEQASDDFDWSIRKNDQNEVPYWILRPRNEHILGTGTEAGVDFEISDIVTHLAQGETHLLFSYKNVPGYLDGLVKLAIEKYYPPQILYFHVGNGSHEHFDQGGQQINLSYKVYSPDKEQWQISSELPSKDNLFVDLFDSPADKDLEGEYTAYIYSSGTFEIDLLLLGHLFQASSSPKASVSVTIDKPAPAQILGFTVNGSESASFPVGGQAIKLKHTVFSPERRLWKLSEESSGLNQTFSSKGNQVDTTYSEVTLYASGAHTIELSSAQGESIESQTVTINIEQPGPTKILNFSSGVRYNQFCAGLKTDYNFSWNIFSANETEMRIYSDDEEFPLDKTFPLNTNQYNSGSYPVTQVINRSLPVIYLQCGDQTTTINLYGKCC